MVMSWWRRPLKHHKQSQAFSGAVEKEFFSSLPHHGVLFDAYRGWVSSLFVNAWRCLSHWLDKWVPPHPVAHPDQKSDHELNLPPCPDGISLQVQRQYDVVLFFWTLPVPLLVQLKDTSCAFTEASVKFTMCCKLFENFLSANRLLMQKSGFVVPSIIYFCLLWYQSWSITIVSLFTDQTKRIIKLQEENHDFDFFSSWETLTSAVFKERRAFQTRFWIKLFSQCWMVRKLSTLESWPKVKISSSWKNDGRTDEGDRGKESKKERQGQRQGQTDRQVDRQTDWLTDWLTDWPTDWHKVKSTNKEADCIKLRQEASWGLVQLSFQVSEFWLLLTFHKLSLTKCGSSWRACWHSAQFPATPICRHPQQNNGGKIAVGAANAFIYETEAQLCPVNITKLLWLSTKEEARQPSPPSRLMTHVSLVP